MIELLNLIDTEMISEMLSPKAKADFAEKMIVVGVVWFVMGRKVSEHFRSIRSEMQDGFAKIAEALKAVESKHETRLVVLEEKVEQLEGQEK